MADGLPRALRENALFLAARTAAAVTQRYRDALAAAGLADLGAAELAVLAALEDGDAGDHPSSLAKALHYEKSTLSPILLHLKEAGLVLQERDPRDARAVRLTITRKGSRRRKEADEVLARVRDELFAGLSKKAVRHWSEVCEAMLVAHTPPRS